VWGLCGNLKEIYLLMVVNKNRHHPSIHSFGGEKPYITTEEFVIENGDNGFSGKGPGVLKTNKNAYGALIKSPS